MSVAEILFVVAGLLLGVAFHGGPFLFLLPFAVVAFVLAWLNRPRLAGNGQSPTSNIPIITIKDRSTATNPAIPTGMQNDFPDRGNHPNEPEADLKVSQIWARANADINRAMTDVLHSLKGFIPNVNTAIIFTQLTSPREWGVRNYVNDREMSVNPSARISENSGLLSQMFRSGVNRILEGDLPNSKLLSYYLDNPQVKSVVAVPMLDHNGNRIGILVLDSLASNAFTDRTAKALSFVASALSMLDYKGFYSAQKHIALQQYAGLYIYQRRFFQTMTVKDIYKQIINYVKENMAYDRLTILAMNHVNESAGRVVFCDGVDAAQFTEKRFTLSDKGIFILAMMHNRPVERDFTQGGFNAYVPRLTDNEKRNLNLRQLFVMPVASESDAQTADLAICLESSRSRPYSEHEKELLKAFAGVAGFAYARARQFEHGRDLAMRDGLTGLINHRTLSECLRSEKVRADRKKYNIGVLMMDIDHFKRVNDTYGHPVGDTVIKGIADAISGEIRKDIDIVARYGGEEFVVGLVETSGEGMIETAQRIRKAVEKLVFDVHLAEPLRVTVSIGAFLVTPDFHDMKEAVNNADKALYRAKEGGRNQVIRFELDESIPDLTPEQLQMMHKPNLQKSEQKPVQQ